MRIFGNPSRFRTRNCCKVQPAGGMPVWINHYVQTSMNDVNRPDAIIDALVRSHGQHIQPAEPAPSESKDNAAGEPDVNDPSGIMRRLLKMRAMMQETRNKSAELKGALDRFKDRQSKISNG